VSLFTASHTASPFTASLIADLSLHRYHRDGRDRRVKAEDV
jgi:hypothetical protein